MKDYRKFFNQHSKLLERLEINEAEEEEEEEGEDDKTEDVDDEEVENEETIVNVFEDESFISAFKNSIKQYVSEKILTDDYNSFSIIPPIDIDYKDETYTLTAKFESAVSITVDDKGDVIDKDISSIEEIRYKTPMMDIMEVLEDDAAKELIELYVMESLNDIKKVAR
tara:strand:+ start:388 stop:891 length:504 start_codon:yes stop_codon:yes gene_type:complete